MKQIYLRKQTKKCRCIFRFRTPRKYYTAQNPQAQITKIGHWPLPLVTPSSRHQVFSRPVSNHLYLWNPSLSTPHCLLNLKSSWKQQSTTRSGLLRPILIKSGKKQQFSDFFGPFLPYFDFVVFLPELLDEVRVLAHQPSAPATV